MLRGVLRTATLVLVPALLLGGCASEGQDSDSDEEPEEQIDAAQAAEVEELYGQVRTLWVETLRGEREAEDARPEIEQLTAGQAQEAVLSELEMWEGVTYQGEPQTDPTVTALSEDTDPPSAVLEDCWDDTTWTAVDDETGEELPGTDQHPRRIIKVRAERADSGEWTLVEWRPEEDRTC